MFQPWSTHLIFDSVFNCIDPALIPLFDDAAMLDEDMIGKQTNRTMSVQVIKDTIEWNDIPDSDLAARMNVREKRMAVF